VKNSRSPGHPRTERHRAGTDAGAGRERSEEAIPRIDSTALLGASGRLIIEHHGQRYELRETRYGKLILTK